ncbi:dsRBD fold-containing protein [Mycobacterium shigaense]|uniref:dsRBD fold-containing protein n=1 Tax=Mycobacterium shigaense TaxID=722731 RepID=UPI000E587156|nr:dsRBD fold-containing protein [Mycobacterium shigaense]
MNCDISRQPDIVDVTVTVDDHGRGHRAKAELRWRGRTLTGFGLSYVEIDNAGEQLAMAQAFSDLSNQLSRPG